jgi:outer membrane protein TolC
MLMIRQFHIFCILFTACTVSATAEDALSPLTLEKAVGMALERHPDILISQEETNELRGRIREVRSGAFPQVSFQGFGLRLRDPVLMMFLRNSGTP